MATAPWKRKFLSEADQLPNVARDQFTYEQKRQRTGHLKAVPESRPLRESLRASAMDLAAGLDKANPLTRRGMERLCRDLLERNGLPDAYLGWTMVMVLSAFWRDQVAAIPYRERLLLLPPATEHGGCGELTAANGRASNCLACLIERYRNMALALGCQVLVAGRSAEMSGKIMTGGVNAMIGVASLDLLERVLDKIVLTGIACQAVPLSTEPHLTIDDDWIVEMIGMPVAPRNTATKTYLHLFRGAGRLFQRDELERLAPRPCFEAPRNGASGSNGVLDPLNATEEIAYNFLAKGGKHSRPFITLAVYDALKGGHATAAGGADVIAKLPDSIRRAALSIETFHKASLVHDDIEDDDEYRYGDQTVHRKYGTATGINVGDYLIGLGYRLVSRETAALGPEVTADILDCLADAHMRLSEGQGAELIWRDSANKGLSPRDAIRIYALKTAPAFQAALYTGIRLVRPIGEYREPIGQFARHLGIAFQILNDLNDWEEDADNKLLAGGDVVGGRPTVLWALALARLSAPDRQALQRLASEQSVTRESLAKTRELYARAGVFEHADWLIEKHQRRAAAVAWAIEPKALRDLLFYLIDMVLARRMNFDGPAEPPASRCAMAR